MRESDRRLTVNLLEVVTVGFPFCAFKVIAGTVLVQASFGVAGVVLIGLGSLDALLNVANFASLVSVRRRLTSSCTLSALTVRMKRRHTAPSETLADLGNAIDVLLSFSVVAAMVGFGKIPTLSTEALHAWSAAVVLNVLGAGLARLESSIRQMP